MVIINKNLRLFFCIFPILLVITVIRAEDIPYTLIMNSNSTNLNLGDLNEIWGFVYGKGEITNAEITVDIPHQLVKDGAIKAFGLPISCKEDCCDFFLIEEEWITLTGRNNLLLGENYFKPSCRDKNYLLSQRDFRNKTHYFAPVNIRFKLN